MRRTSIDAQGLSVGGVAGAAGGLGSGVDVDFLVLYFEDFESLVVDVGVGDAVPELGGEGGLSCGAKADASTRAISLSSQCSFIPSLNFFSSFMTKTSSRLRTPSITAARSSSLRRTSPRPSALPVLRQRILRWLFRVGWVRDWRVGEKNMDSSSG